MDRKWMGVLLAAAFPISSPALAQTSPETSTQPAATQHATPAPAPSLGPSMTGPLHLNSKPLHVDGGPFGPIYVSGVISGLGLVQDNPFTGDQDSHVDLSNGMAIVQTTQGIVQFYAQVGGYSFPSIGTPYFKAKHIVDNTFGLPPCSTLPSASAPLELGRLRPSQLVSLPLVRAR